jgi:tetraacyldisaccharide 4'-kinase
MRWFDLLLSPFAFLYGSITDLRNHFFDIGLKKSSNFTVPTIVVGNLRIGGTGKTPMVEFIVKSLFQKHKISILSRGYGRKTKGFIWADDSSRASEIGDEPFQIFSKFYPKINVAVCEDRVIAVPQILMNDPSTDIIVLDDAFQHRYLKADAYVLLTTYDQPFYKDHLLPIGGLREKRKGAERADMVVVTKCPSTINEAEKDKIRLEISKYVKNDTPVLFSFLAYGLPYEISSTGNKVENKVILVSALADASALKKQVQNEFELIEDFDFPDHHRYSINDLLRFKKSLEKSPNSVIITTEKDAAKFKKPEFESLLKEIPIFALPIEFKLSESDQKILINFLHQLIEEKAYTREI